MVNKVILIGNLGSDPEVRRLESGVAVAKLNIATNETYKDKNGERQTQTEWHNVVCWRGLAEIAEQYLKKGSLVFVEGKLTTRKWQDKDGNDRYTTEVVANNFRMMDRRDSNSGGYRSNFPGAADAPPATQTHKNPDKPVAESAEKTAESVADAPEDDLPF